MKSTIKLFAEQIAGIRPGKVGVGFLETFRVSIRGNLVPIGKLGAMRVQGDQVHISPFDPATVPAIVRTLVEAKMNAYALNPSTVCVGVPPASVEQQDEVARHVKSLGEQAKIAIRGIRQDSRKQIVSRGRGSLNAVQADTDAAIAEVDALVAAKVAGLVGSSGRRRS
ncbi:ribosome-recycling factor [Isosphaeraceae bacterium EP7]